MFFMLNLISIINCSKDQIRVPDNNPVVHATRDEALVRLVFVITKEGSNTPEYDQDTHYEILKEFERRYKVAGELFKVSAGIGSVSVFCALCSLAAHCEQRRARSFTECCAKSGVVFFLFI